MQHASRPIAAFAVIGALSLLVAGCTGSGDEPTPSPTRTASAPASAGTQASATATATTEPAAVDAPSTGAPDDSTAPGDDDTPGAFPGTGTDATPQPDTDPAEFPATAVVTYAGWDTASKSLQAGGLVSGTTDASGTCTFTAKAGSTVRTLTGAAEASASSVNCAQVSFPAAQVSSGTWSVTLQYSVGSRATTSDPMTAEVP